MNRSIIRMHWVNVAAFHLVISEIFGKHFETFSHFDGMKRLLVGFVFSISFCSSLLFLHLSVLFCAIFFCLVKIETCFTFFCIRFLAQFSLRVGIHQRNGNQIFPLESNCVLRFTFSGRMKRIKAVDLVEIGMNSNECCRTVDYTLNLVCLIDYAHWPNHIRSRTNAQTHTRRHFIRCVAQNSISRTASIYCLNNCTDKLFYEHTHN